MAGGSPTSRGPRRCGGSPATRSSSAARSNDWLRPALGTGA
jgi:hypothetical protein